MASRGELLPYFSGQRAEMALEGLFTPSSTPLKGGKITSSSLLFLLNASREAPLDIFKRKKYGKVKSTGYRVESGGWGTPVSLRLVLQASLVEMEADGLRRRPDTCSPQTGGASLRLSPWGARFTLYPLASTAA